MEIGRRMSCVYIDGQDHLTFDGIDLYGPGGGGQDDARPYALLMALGSTHITTRNCTVKNSTGTAIGYRSGCDYGTVENCIIEWVWGGVHGYGPTHYVTVRNNMFRYIGALVVSNGDRGVVAAWGHHWLVENNYIENHGWQGTVDPDGITHSMDLAITFCCGELAGTDDSGWHIVRYNYLKNLTGGGIQFSGGDYNEAYYNIIDGWNLQNQSYGDDGNAGAIKAVTWGSAPHPVNTGNKIYANVVFGGKQVANTDKDAAVLTGGQNVELEVKNNIVFGNEAGVKALYASFGTGTSGCEIENNLFNVPGGDAIRWWHWVYDFEHVVSPGGCPAEGYWQCERADTNTGVVSENIVDDPMFTDAASGDFTLEAGSPCIDTGKNLGEGHDEGLSPASSWLPVNVITADQDEHGTGWEMGAYVDMEGDDLPPAPPMNLTAR
jgi:hypothetical protein